MSSMCIDSVPDIHSCMNMRLENAHLKRKLHKLRHESKMFKDQLEAVMERQKIETLMRQYVTTHNMETQTDPLRSHFSTLQIQRKKETEKQVDNERLNKLLAMHNALSRRHEKELRNSMQQVETITELQLKVNSLEQKLKEASLHDQEKESHRRYKRSRRLYDSDEESESCRLKENIRKVKKERDKLSAENKKMKTEIKGLDAGFFEEIEDLKYALQQAAQLNKRYEQSLRRVCAKFGLPYPNPEKSLDNCIT